MKMEGWYFSKGSVYTAGFTDPSDEIFISVGDKRDGLIKKLRGL
jgi:hypothetical protein